MRALRIGLLLVLACACRDESDMRPPSDGPPFEPDVPDGGFFVDDRDEDGLCDTTEADFGSDPGRSDSDGDGVPDLIELANGFDATDAAQPASDHIAYLLAKPGSALDFPVRVTLDGDGGGVVGRFEEGASAYPEETDARDFLREALAVSADPVDSVRRIDAEAARFRSVLGRTRLEFSLRFSYPLDEALSCARAYPFRYVLEADSAEVLAEGWFLLVVSPAAEDTGDGDYCLPSGCQ